MTLRLHPRRPQGRTGLGCARPVTPAALSLSLFVRDQGSMQSIENKPEQNLIEIMTAA
jgi:hypothetical protein